MQNIKAGPPAPLDAMRCEGKLPANFVRDCAHGGRDGLLTKQKRHEGATRQWKIVFGKVHVVQVAPLLARPNREIQSNK